MRRATALALIRQSDIIAELFAAGRTPTAVDLDALGELTRAAEAEDRAAWRAGTTDPGSAGAAAKTAGRPGAQPRSTGGAS